MFFGVESNTELFSMKKQVSEQMTPYFNTENEMKLTRQHIQKNSCLYDKKSHKKLVKLSD